MNSGETAVDSPRMLTASDREWLRVQTIEATELLQFRRSVLEAKFDRDPAFAARFRTFTARLLVHRLQRATAPVDPGDRSGLAEPLPACRPMFEELLRRIALCRHLN